jgi:hypothetical protein
MHSTKASYTLKHYTGGSFKTQARLFASRIAKVVYTMHFVTKLVQQGIGYLLEKAENLEVDAELLTATASTAGGVNFITTLHRYFFSKIGGRYMAQNVPRSSLYGVLDAMFSDLYLVDEIDQSKFVFRIPDKTIWDGPAKSLDASLAKVFVGQIHQLQKDVRAHYRGDPREEDVRLQVESLMAHYNQPDDSDRVFRFLKLNSLLPKEKRRKLFPVTGSRHGYTCLTEMSLFRIVSWGHGAVTLSTGVFTERHVEVMKGLFLYHLLSFRPIPGELPTTPLKWRTKTGALRKFQFLHNTIDTNYGMLRLFITNVLDTKY